ncbi:hypothetical protein D3C73_1542450 [compost metagenome]
MGLHIPLDQIAADPADEVIVVQLKQDIAAPESNDLIYVDAQVTENRLLSFYAKQYGDAMKFGDGKRDRYYVSG